MSGQSDPGTNLLPDPYGFVRIQFQINCFLFWGKSMQILFTDRALLTIRRMDKIVGKVSLLSYSPKNYSSLRAVMCLLHCPDSALHWLDLNGWVDIKDYKYIFIIFDDTEFASVSSVEWCNIHQWGIICQFNRCCHFVYGDAAMWLKCVRHPKYAIFMQNFAISATPAHVCKKTTYPHIYVDTVGDRTTSGILHQWGEMGRAQIILKHKFYQMLKNSWQ